MVDSTLKVTESQKAPRSSPRPRWRFWGIALSFGFCLIGIWRISQFGAPQGESITITALDASTRNPIQGVRVVILDLNFGLPVQMPGNANRWNLLYQPIYGITNNQGKATLVPPVFSASNQRVRYALAYGTNTLPPGAKTRWEGTLFQDREITLLVTSGKK